MNEWLRKQAEGMRNMTEKELAEYFGVGAAQSPPKTKEQQLEEARQMVNVYQLTEEAEPDCSVKPVNCMDKTNVTEKET